MTNITWTCHICGKERPDDKISVFTKDLSASRGLPPGTMKANVRYCNDNPRCCARAPEHDLAMDEFQKRAKTAAQSPAMQAAYVEQIKKMIRQARAWRRAHPQANPKIQFNFPPNTLVAIPLAGALEHGFMSVNDEGRELIAAMWAGMEERKEPTPGMIRCVMKLIDSPDV